MKKTTMLLCCFMTSLIYLACTNDGSTSVGETQTEETIYEKTGRLHNEGLHYLFGKIQDHTLTRSGEFEMPDESILYEYLNEYLKSIGEETSLGIGDVLIPESDWEDAESLFGDYIPSVEEAVYFNRLIRIGTENSDRLVVNNKILMLEEEISSDNNLPLRDKENLLYAMAVCRYSFDYWLENMPEWNDALNGQPTTRGFWGDLWSAAWRTGVVDAGGGLVGALVGGVGALPGACGASFMYALTESVEEKVVEEVATDPNEEGEEEDKVKEPIEQDEESGVVDDDGNGNP